MNSLWIVIQKICNLTNACFDCHAGNEGLFHLVGTQSLLLNRWYFLSNLLGEQLISQTIHHHYVFRMGFLSK